MKSKKNLPHAVTCLVMLTAGVALCSWIGNIYNPDKVQSLLSPEGIRWELRHAVDNFVQTPALGIVSTIFIGLGTAWYSGIGEILGRIARREKTISRRERRSIVLTGCALTVYLVMIACATLTPWTILRSVTGSLVNSPLQQGIPLFTSIGLGIMGLVFGFASGRFRNDHDVVRAMSSLYARFADYFVLLFFIVQFFASLDYSRLTELIGISPTVLRAAFNVCCYLPLAVTCLRTFARQTKKP